MFVYKQRHVGIGYENDESCRSIEIVANIRSNSDRHGLKLL